MFNISKDWIKRARDTVKQYVTPNYIGFHHISRDNIIKAHNRPLAQALFGDLKNQTGILVIDGTYIYIHKRVENLIFNYLPIVCTNTAIE